MSAPRWTGRLPEECEICGLPLHGKFVDGATRSGTWAIMCLPCHAGNGCGLGTGCGQKYNIAAHGESCICDSCLTRELESSCRKFTQAEAAQIWRRLLSR